VKAGVEEVTKVVFKERRREDRWLTAAGSPRSTSLIAYVCPNAGKFAILVATMIRLATAHEPAAARPCVAAISAS
jgi:hypothetical protein